MGKISVSNEHLDFEVEKDDYEFFTKISKHNIFGLLGDKIAEWRFINAIKIAEKTRKYAIEHNISPKLIPSKFLAKFMEEASLEEDEDMQSLWAILLAKECEESNNAHIQMIRILSEIQPQYAKVFVSVCRLMLHILVFKDKDMVKEMEYSVPFVNIRDAFYYDNLALDFETLSELQNYGLIELGSAERFFIAKKSVDSKSSELRIYYHGKALCVPNYVDKDFPMGYLTLTNAGRCFLSITEEDITDEPVEGHFERFKDYLEKKNISNYVFLNSEDQ